MEIKLDDIEMLTVLHALETMYNQSQEYKDVVYDNIQDFLLDINKTRMLHNKLLMQHRMKVFLKIMKRV